MSYVTLTYHLIFSAYGRLMSINHDCEHELYRFIYYFLKSRDIFVRRIGGMPDHVHILCDIPPKHAVADVVKSLKAESSKYLLANPHFPLWQKWSRRYGCFTVSYMGREAVREYIMNQRIHHSTCSFREEFMTLMVQNGYTPDIPALGDGEV